MTLPLDFGALGAAMERVEMERRAGVKRTAEETKAAIRAALAAGPTGPSDHGALIAAADRYAAACAAVTVAQAAEEAAWAPWRAYVATRSAHDSEAMRLKRPAIAAGSAVRVAESARDAAGAAVLAAARGER